MFYEAIFEPSKSMNYNSEAKKLAGKRIAVQDGWVVEEGPFKGKNSMDTTRFILLAIINIPIFFLFGKLYFEDWEDFKTTIRAFYNPSSLMDKEDHWRWYWTFGVFQNLSPPAAARAKLQTFILICLGIVLGEYYLIQTYVYSGF